ncbi:hypothetical protein PHYPSEUDO_014454 [Phytophthora pseudosyringae]|uniref:Uncharacterized protein n=1 Tax=Phytophthora pseudosyringae TaxID=221518 RepID=A0A8T1V5A6_9STRA|nr:hypothetical protein PHYPSEUDO_014449 [Phytophthora pseudosyringae]KAG7376096.1 hypothetical protein PHYPSEUDO_014454 [Phytophthora pseudosyringae]
MPREKSSPGSSSHVRLVPTTWRSTSPIAVSVGPISTRWRATASYSCVVGHEIVGEVTLAGANVEMLAVGDRVAVGAHVWACWNKNPDAPCRNCALREDALCDHAVYTYDSTYEDGSPSYGGYADYIRLDSNYAFKLPDNLSSDVAAPLMYAGVTVFTPLKREGVKAGDRVGVVGVAFSRSANKEQEVRALGAAEFFNLSSEDGQKKATNSVDYLILTAHANNMPYNLYLSLLHECGTLIMLGIPNDEIKFSPLFVMRALRVHGSLIGGIQDVKDVLGWLPRRTGAQSR